MQGKPETPPRGSEPFSRARVCGGRNVKDKRGDAMIQADVKNPDHRPKKRAQNFSDFCCGGDGQYFLQK
jgi:hypothetical protein